MIDLANPKEAMKITLNDLKQCRLTPVFFDTFFNLEKYLDHEQRDPFASQRDEDGMMSDWDRYVCLWLLCILEQTTTIILYLIRLLKSTKCWSQKRTHRTAQSKLANFHIYLVHLTFLFSTVSNLIVCYFDSVHITSLSLSPYLRLTHPMDWFMFLESIHLPHLISLFIFVTTIYLILLSRSLFLGSTKIFPTTKLRN